MKAGWVDGERVAGDDELDAKQLAAMDRAMDRLRNAQRYDGVGDDAAGAVEALIRRGRVSLAYRRLARVCRGIAEEAP